MTPDPYEHVREAFHTVADGLMDWEDPPERAVRRSNGLRGSYLGQDIPALENAAEWLTRAGQIQLAIPLWSLALKVRTDLDASA